MGLLSEADTFANRFMCMCDVCPCPCLCVCLEWIKVVVLCVCTSGRGEREWLCYPNIHAIIVHYYWLFAAIRYKQTILFVHSTNLLAKFMEIVFRGWEKAHCCFAPPHINTHTFTPKHMRHKSGTNITLNRQNGKNGRTETIWHKTHIYNDIFSAILHYGDFLGKLPINSCCPLVLSCCYFPKYTYIL